MKKIPYIFSVLLLMATILSCTPDRLNSNGDEYGCCTDDEPNPPPPPPPPPPPTDD
ncbi:MAG: hypothetical protein ACSHW7_00020 [Patiriisocius sp.]|uniref:hypothetical protein n=1 Tax=Patiriisocius sp. TaxID=2822396 RepID=UPI003EF9CDD8